MRRTLAIPILLALAASGCMSWSGRDASVGTPRGTIEATVRMVGGPAPGHRRLKDDEIEVLAGTRLVARVRTDEHGRFRLSVAPGRYRFRVRSGPDLYPLTGAVVTAAHTTMLRLTLNVK